ncbi:MAG: hypothetical protein MJE66_15285 [Proteobacteria bacterium]|nr:hypothetical protein [Pseudomonadota bacterium]
MAAASEPLLIDGDQSIEVYGASITVGAVVPASVQDAGAPQRPLEVPAGELAVDDLLGCRIVGIQESRGSRSALLTDYLTVGPNDDAALPIPRGAEDVLVSPAVAGTVSAWRFTIGDPSVLASTAPAASFSPTDTSVRVPTASHLAVASDGTTRFFSITWKVRA